MATSSHAKSRRIRFDSSRTRFLTILISLIPAGAIADPVPSATTDIPYAALPAGASLRDALGLLVSSGADYVVVLDEWGGVCGRVGLQNIRLAARGLSEQHISTGGRVGDSQAPDRSMGGNGHA